MFVRTFLAAVLALSVAHPALAQSMNAEEFYQRALKLKKKGPMALLNQREVKLLVAEVRGAGDVVKDRRLAAEKAGGRGAYCPPKGKKGMTSDEYLNGIGAIPKGERAKMSMTDAVTRMLATMFPCAK